MKLVSPVVLETTTGCFQLFLSAMTAGLGLSRRETPTPTKPLNTGLGKENSTVVLKAVIRLA